MPPPWCTTVLNSAQKRGGGRKWTCKVSGAMTGWSKFTFLGTKKSQIVSRIGRLSWKASRHRQLCKKIALINRGSSVGWNDLQVSANSKGFEGGERRGGGLVSRDFFPLFFQVGRRQKAPFVFILPSSSFFSGSRFPPKKKKKKRVFTYLSRTHTAVSPQKIEERGGIFTRNLMAVRTLLQLCSART